MKPARLSTLFYFVFLGMELSYLYILASLLSGPIYALILMLLLYPFALLSKLALPRSAFSHRLRFTLEVALVTLVIVTRTTTPTLASLACRLEQDGHSLLWISIKQATDQKRPVIVSLDGRAYS